MHKTWLMKFSLVSNNLVFPPLYPEAERTLATSKSKSRTIVDGYELRPNQIDLIPQPGLQEQLCQSEANLVFICGQATSGKTFAMYLNALQGVTHYGFAAKLISVRLQDSKKGGSMFRDGVTVCGNFANCEYNSADYPTFSWPQWNSSLQLIHSNFNVSNPVEWEQFQDYAKKVQASLIMVDEATEMKEFKMFAYWFSRNRDSSGMTPQMVLSFNPSHDHWTTQMLCDAGYIGDDWYLRKDMIGKVRYWYNKGKSPAEIVWGTLARKWQTQRALSTDPTIWPQVSRDWIM